MRRARRRGGGIFGSRGSEIGVCIGEGLVGKKGKRQGLMEVSAERREGVLPWEDRDVGLDSVQRGWGEGRGLARAVVV